MLKTDSAPEDDYLARLQNAIRRLSGCESKYLETVAVSQPFLSFRHNTIWQGDVVVFEVYGHPKAQRAYVWSSTADNEEAEYVVVLELPPVSSPQTAVQAAIAARIVNGTFR